MARAQKYTSCLANILDSNSPLQVYKLHTVMFCFSTRYYGSNNQCAFDEKIFTFKVVSSSIINQNGSQIILEHANKS